MREFRNDITYNQLITFQAIFEAGSISHAAKQLSITPATVSASLKLLEQQLGQVLFARTTRSITPTECARQLYESTRFKIRELATAVDRACEVDNEPSGRLSVNMAVSMYHWFYKDMLIAFQRAYPKVVMELTLSDTLDDTIEQDIDVGFRYGQRVDERLVARQISTRHHCDGLRVALFTSRRYAESIDIPKSIAELSAHPMVKFRMPGSLKLAPLRLHQQPDPRSEIVNVDVDTAMVVNDLGVLVDMVAGGFGIGMAMDFVIRERLEAGELVPILKEHWCELPPVYIYYPPENKQSLKIRCFIDYFLQHCP